MRAFLLFILLFVEALAYGQGFNKRYDAFGWGFYQQAFNIEVDIDGFVVIGVTEDYDTISPGSYFFHASVLFERFDHTGAKLMEKRTWRALHNTVVGWANCCDTIAGGGYVVGGASEDTTGYDEVFLIRFDAAGDTLWTKVFGDTSGENWWIGYQVKYIPENGFAIVGGTGDNELNGNADGFIIRTDSIGNELWRRTYGWTSTFWDGFISVDIAADGHLFTGGTRNFSNGTTNRWVQRVDGVGDVQWSQHWGGRFPRELLPLLPFRMATLQFLVE